MRANAIHELVHWLTQHGRPVEPLLKAAGLAQFDLSDPDNVIPMLPACEFVRLVQNNEGPDIGCRIVTPATFSRLGNLGRVLLAGPSIHEALAKLAVIFSMQTTHSHLTLASEKDCIAVRHFHVMPFGDEFIHISQQYNATLLWNLCRMTGAPEPWFKHLEILPHPQFGLDHLKPYFGAVLQPSASRCLFVAIPRAVADLPFNNKQTLASDGVPEWRSLRGTGKFADSVRLIVGELLSDSEPTIQQVAAICGFSVRTFQRRLESEGENFTSLLDDVRRELIMTMIGSSEHSVNEAGVAAGYNSPGSITRAVRRWTGSSPRDLKRRSIPPGENG